MSENIAKLTAERDQTLLLGLSHNLTTLNHKLSSENENLRRDHDNLMGRMDELTYAYNASQSQITNLRTEKQQLKTHKQELETYNQELERQIRQLKTEKQQLGRYKQELEIEKKHLKTENQQLKTRNQQLETERNTFTKTIEDMKTQCNELVVNRNQWIIDAYCPKKDGERQCERCPMGWKFFQSSCYVFNYVEWRSWDEAQTSCKDHNSDLVVVVDEEEKATVSESLASSETSGYWIGLRVVDGKWKWVDGSDLTECSWRQPPADGHCAMSVRTKGWRSVSCAATNYWICKQKALD
ncbi:C-type lectin domain family 10 member A-like [Chaetodon trifascialis]|uniref:C-type lectin domain family 10 member A-like n=1 Tax=Chaetodon trifascialis TaxID=109706 RepID=UPI003991050A